MKKWIIGFFSFFLLINLSYGATRGDRVQKKISKNFTSGSIVSGAPATGKVRRWYFFNEGAVGTSYTFLGKSDYLSVDLGYNFYLRSIESVLGGMNFIIGSEISVPLFLKTMPKSRSNILNDHRYLERNETEGLAGVGVEVPLLVGFEYKGFYIAGLAGYTWLFMKDTYTSNTAGTHPTIKTQYDGVIYGGGIGYKVSNIVNIGVRYTGGFLTNRGGDKTELSNEATSQGLGSMLITGQTKRDIYDIPYHRIHFFVSIIF